MNGSLKHGQKILKEIDSSTIATKEDIHLYAQHLGIVLPDEQDLLWIAQAGLEVSLPPPWCPVEDSQGRIYYYNSVTKETKWEHPLDSYYKTMVKKERLKASARATTADSNIEDSGTSLMSSLDDVPPLSSFAKVSVVDQTIVPFSHLKKAKKDFLSKSCPTNLHILSIKSGPLVKVHKNKHAFYYLRSTRSPSIFHNERLGSCTLLSLDARYLQQDTDSESHTATLQNEDDRPDMKELLARKQALELELERLKREVQKYQRIREQLRASTKKDLIQFGVTSLTYRSRHHRHNMVTDGRQDQDKCPPPALPGGDVSGAKAKEEGSKQQAKPSTAPSGRSSLGHKDLLRLSQRITQLRQRQLQLSLRAAQQVAEDALAGFAVPRTPGSDFTSKDLVAPPSMKLAPSSSELVPHRPRRALTDVPHSHSQVEATHGGLVAQYWGPHTSQVQDVQPTQQWSRAEWTAKLSQLRWSLKECELQQLLIK